MPRRSRERRERYMRDRAERRRERRERRERGYYGYPMDYRGGDREYRDMNDYARGRDRDYDYAYDMRGDYRGDYRGEDYARRGVGRPREYRRGRDRAEYRDYAEDDDYEKEYYEDLEDWIEKLKRYDRFGLSKDQVMQKARDMGVKFEEYEPEEFYAIYLMHVSDYPNISNDPHTYLAMTKAWLEDKDLKIDASEKVCKYMYEIAMADDED